MQYGLYVIYTYTAVGRSIVVMKITRQCGIATYTYIVSTIYLTEIYYDVDNQKRKSCKKNHIIIWNTKYNAEIIISPTAIKYTNVKR